MNNSEWISVKDRLPDCDENVLAYNPESGCIDIEFFNGNSWILVDLYDLYDEFIYMNPTHWMPLPDAPEVEG